MARNEQERWGNSRHKSHAQKRPKTGDLLNAAASMPVKPYAGTPPRNLNAIPPTERATAMKTSTNDLHRQALGMIDWLNTSDAIALMGSTYCETERLLLIFAIDSITQAEALERLKDELSIIKTQVTKHLADNEGKNG